MNKERIFFKRHFIPGIIILFLIILDQYTKLLASTRLKGSDSLDVIPNVLQLHYLENKGAAFGMMQNRQIFFTIGAILIVLVVAYYWNKVPFTSKYLPLRISSILIISGAIGNMIDRIYHHYVIDFIYFELINFPIFNVADIYVTIACFLFCYLIIFYYKDENLNFRG